MDDDLHFYGKGPDRPWVNSRLTSAGIVGHTTKNSAHLWVRVWAEGRYALVLSGTPIPAGPSGARPGPADGALVFEMDFADDTDYTGVFKLAGLAPGTTYYYALYCVDPDAGPGWELPPNADYRFFRTQREASDKLSFGLISCHMPYAENGDVLNMQMWERLYGTLEEEDADFLLAGGDQIYVDGNDAISIWRWLMKVKAQMSALPAGERVEVMRSWYRDIYRGYWGFPWLTRTFGRFPTYMMWDDHEIMDGWGSYTRDGLAEELRLWWEMSDAEKSRELARSMFEAATRTYVEYEHSHNPRTDEGVFDYAFSLHGCAFYVLDMRGHRNYENDHDERVLGTAQMERFLAWLASPEVAAARAVFVLSPVPVVHAANFVVNKFDLSFLGLADDLRDEWEHRSNWSERNRLLSAVFAFSHEKGRTVAFLSGDVHIGAAFRVSCEKWSKAKVYQLTSSAITYPAPEALALVVRDAGWLGDADGVAPQDRYSYRCLDKLPQNNFGIVRVEGDAADASVTWILYSRAPDGKNIVRHKRIDL